jgi:hypothetical protein
VANIIEISLKKASKGDFYFFYFFIFLPVEGWLIFLSPALAPNLAGNS